MRLSLRPTWWSCPLTGLRSTGPSWEWLVIVRQSYVGLTTIELIVSLKRVERFLLLITRFDRWSLMLNTQHYSMHQNCHFHSPVPFKTYQLEKRSVVLLLRQTQGTPPRFTFHCQFLQDLVNVVSNNMLNWGPVNRHIFWTKISWSLQISQEFGVWSSLCTIPYSDMQNVDGITNIPHTGDTESLDQWA